MTDLTFLHNPTRHTQAIHHLLTPHNHPPLNLSKDERDWGLKPLLEVLQIPHGRVFAHSIGDFLELLLALSQRGKVAYSTTIHPSLNEAAKLLSCALAISPTQSISQARQQGAKSFILSPIHDEIFTLAPHIDKQKDECLILDMSLALASGYCHIESLHTHTLEADGFLLEGEMLGLLRGYGAFLQKTAILPKVAPIMGLGQALLEALYTLKTISPHNQSQNQSDVFLKQLKANLPTLECFSDHTNTTLHNTLALRFRGIKARDLITATAHDNLMIANGRRCLFGLGQPSYVLESMGFSDKEQRELISLSWKCLSIEEIQRISSILALRYKQVLALTQDE